MNRHFIAFGGAGCNIMEEALSLHITGQFTYVNRKERETLKPQARFVPFTPPGLKRLHNSELDVLSDMGLDCELPGELIANLSHKVEYVLMAGLGGYTGTKLLKKFADFLEQNGFRFSIFCSLPFGFESGDRMQNAKLFLSVLSNTVPRRVFHLEEMAKELGELEFAKVVLYTNRYIARELVWGV